MTTIDEELIELIQTRYIPPCRPIYVEIPKQKHRSHVIYDEKVNPAYFPDVGD